MAQNTDVLLPATRYTRSDFAALRAYLNRLPLHQISSLYYLEEDLAALSCATENRLKARLEDLRDRLIKQAAEQNPHLADLLRNARQGGNWSPKLANFLLQAGESDLATPRRGDPVAAWFRPRVSEVLRREGVRSLGDLIAIIEQRGAGWWKPLPRLGQGKAGRITEWLAAHAGALGGFSLPQAPDSLIAAADLLPPDATQPVPMERLDLPSRLDGREGRNRNPGFCLISARHDKEAIEAYLYKFRGQEKTLRAYQKELERFLLWCVSVRGVPLSSVLQEDCEAYKDFLGDLPAHWIGPKQQRLSRQWRPFAGPLSAASQRYAIQALRFFFNWLVDVRYLAGNPWATVANPRTQTAINKMQVEKALPMDLWDKLTAGDGILACLAALPEEELRRRYKPRGAMAGASLAAQYRLVHAALLLIGETGIRREEAAYATRDRLKPLPDNEHMWELDVLGKRSKWRTVFPSVRCIDALRRHWQDRHLDFSFGLTETPLLSPLVAPPTRAARAKHRDADGAMKESGFSPDGLYQLIKTALKRIADDPQFALEAPEREQLRRAAPHAFRHTFGTQAVAGEVPLDVVQKVLGHASLQTTTLYVQAEKQRSIRELGKFFKKTVS